ncbi:MAG: hypothetical protein WA220_05430 [Candidatus Nitrosopolaris sp.]
MDCVQIKERDLPKRLASLDLDEGIRIEGQSQTTKIFINRNASGNFVVQFVDNMNSLNNSTHNIKYLYSPAEVLKFVKSTFDKNFSISLY